MHRLTIIALALLAAACAAPVEPDPRIESILDRQAVEDMVTALFVAVDTKDWKRTADLLAEQVHFDVTSLAGGEPGLVSRESIIEGWRSGLEPIQAVHHQAGNYEVEIDAEGATVLCYAIATHYAPERDQAVTTFVGDYEIHLVRAGDGWLIDRFRYNNKYVN
jgi:hypothetical protein